MSDSIKFKIDNGEWHEIPQPTIEDRLLKAKNLLPKLQDVLQRRDAIVDEFESLCEEGFFSTGESPSMSFCIFRDLRWMMKKLFDLSSHQVDSLINETISRTPNDYSKHIFP